MSDNRDPNDDMSWLDDRNNSAKTPPTDNDPLGSDELVMPDWDLFADESDEVAALTAPDDTFAGLLDAADDDDDLTPRSADDPAIITDEIPAWLQASAPEGDDSPAPMDSGLDFGTPPAAGLDFGVSFDPPAPPPSAEVPAWLGMGDAGAEAGGDEDIPPWLAEADETSEEAIQAAEAVAEEMSAPGDEESFLPPWLQDADDLGAEEANAFQASFDDLDFGVDEAPAAPAAAFAPPPAAPADDMPDWMRTQEQGRVDDDLASLLDVTAVPGETTDPLLADLLNSAGSSGPDIDLLSLLEGGTPVQTGMLSQPPGGTDSPADPDGFEMPDFDLLMGGGADDDDVPSDTYSPILDEPSPEPDAAFDFSAMLGAAAAASIVDDEPPAAAPQPPPAVIPPAAAAPKRRDDPGFDSFLDSLASDDLISGAEDSEPLDLEALLREPSPTPDPVRSRGSTGPLEPADDAPPLPEFLRGVSVSDNSAASLLRQQQDVPLDELPDELRALHDELAGIGATAVAASPAVMPMIQAATTPPQVAAPVGLTDGQRKGAELLRNLSALTGASVEGGEVVAPTGLRPRPRRIWPVVARLMVVALLTAAVVLPLVSDSDALRVGVQPPAAFARSSAGDIAYNFIDSLPAGSMVLISVDYNPGSIAELDPLVTPLLRHLFVRGVKPVIVGTDPVTLQYVGRLTDEIGQGRQRNVDYVVGRFLLGDAVGTQTLVRDLAPLLATDIDGQPTGLDMGGLNDFAGAVILTDRSDAVRTWAEQVAPVVRLPLAYAVTAGAAPLSDPYAELTGGPMLVGLRDGMTYTRQLDAQYAPTDFIFVPLPTPTPIPTLPPTAVPEVTEEPETAAGEEATAEGTPSSDEATPEANLTASPEPEPTAESAGTTSPTGQFAVMTGTTRINLRNGPGTDFDVITVVAPGTQFAVASISDDEEWVEVILPEGVQLWVAASRVRLTDEGGSSAPDVRVGAGGLEQASPLREATSLERRWDSVALGAVVAAILIGVGCVVGVFQIILRRRR